MSKDQIITITINGHTHRFNNGDFEAIKKLPWPERKALIELLENIKQAEYVKPIKDVEVEDAKFEVNLQSASVASNTSLSKKAQNIAQTKQLNQTLDSQIKPSDKDVDELMSRLIVEQKQTHSSVPDKASVYKWLLIVFAVIFGLALIF